MAQSSPMPNTREEAGGAAAHRAIFRTSSTSLFSCRFRLTTHTAI
jgi:hypothetical protein